MHKVFLGMGGNLGDPERTILKAIGDIGEFSTVDSVSSFFFSPLLKLDGTEDLNAPIYCNCVALIYTNLSPEKLLYKMQNIEKNYGRIRDPNNRNGSRTLDIDLLYFDDLVVESQILAIPHPRINKRAFVLVPLKEIAPDFVCPKTGTSISKLLEDLTSLTSNHI